LAITWTSIFFFRFGSLFVFSSPLEALEFWWSFFFRRLILDKKLAQSPAVSSLQKPLLSTYIGVSLGGEYLMALAKISLFS